MAGHASTFARRRRLRVKGPSPLDRISQSRPFTALSPRIDGSFVREMLNSETDRAMVEMIVHMAKVMGKGVIAECVESDEIFQALREVGVDYAQGYAIGRPEPFERTYPLIADERREVA
jgi:EAL domain-containing protein (putative c-di-GMP-specific phosphodiesterase class I)